MQSDNYLRKRMELDVLTAISPIDGRYRGKTKALAAYFSEFALIKYRVQVEVEYFITLCELPLPQLKGIDNSVFETLRNIYRNFSEADAQRIKDIESVTNHDVKAVEYFLKEEFDKMGGMDDYKEFIHFGLTSQDINNTSVPLSIKEALDKVYYPLIEELIAQYQVEEIVLGLPKNMNNTLGDRAEKSLELKETLERRTGLPVVMWDERLTTVSANRVLMETGVRRENRKEHVDEIAAVFILQGYLDYLANKNEETGR